MRVRPRFTIPGVLGFASLAAIVGCNTAALLAPPPPLRAASASTFAIDVEFAEPLDKTSAETATHYIVFATASPGAPAAVIQAALIDTLYGRVVRLFVQDQVTGVLPDSTDYTVETNGVLSLFGKSTGSRVVSFRTGLNYGAPIRDLFARHCDSCHGATRSDGTYRTDSYAALTGPGTSAAPNLIAGDPNCLLVVKTGPDKSMFRAGNLSYLDSEIIHNWVVSYQVRL